MVNAKLVLSWTFPIITRIIVFDTLITNMHVIKHQNENAAQPYINEIVVNVILKSIKLDSVSRMR